MGSVSPPPPAEFDDSWPNAACNMKYIAVILSRKWRRQKTRPSTTPKVGEHVPPNPGICGHG